MIITGAPVETMPFEDVKYWEELKTYILRNIVIIHEGNTMVKVVGTHISF